MALSRPSDADEPCYRWHGVGPVCTMMEVAEGFEWTQCCYSAMMLMAWGGPLLLTRYVIGDLEWPQCWCWVILPMIRGGPILSQKEWCRGKPVALLSLVVNDNG